MRSVLPLPLPAAEDAPWDCDVRWGRAQSATRPPPGNVIAKYLNEDGTWWYVGTEEPDRYRLRFRQCGEFVITRDLSEIEVCPDPEGGKAEILPILLAGTVTAFWLSLAGRPVLHASAVAFQDRAIAFVGQSGRGKTTVAALLCSNGAELVTDDVLAVDPGPPATCIGGAGELRLRPAAQSVAEAFAKTASARTTEDHRLALAPPAVRNDRLPLTAIGIPAPSREASEVEIRHVPPATAVFVLLAFPRVLGWEKQEVLEREFDILSKLVETVPVYGVTVPWGPPFSPKTATALRRLADGGQMPAEQAV